MNTQTERAPVPAGPDDDWDHLYDTDPDWALCGRNIHDLPEVDDLLDDLCPMCDAIDRLTEELEQ